MEMVVAAVVDSEVPQAMGSGAKQEAATSSVWAPVKAAVSSAQGWT